MGEDAADEDDVVATPLLWGPFCVRRGSLRSPDWEGAGGLGYGRTMRLILVRHGRTSSNVGLLLDTGEPGADLDEHGRQQAETLVERLADHRIDAIFASNLVRTQQTAAPVAAARGLTVRVLAGLREVPAGEDEMTPDATRYIGAMIAWGQ